MAVASTTWVDATRMDVAPTMGLPPQQYIGPWAYVPTTCTSTQFVDPSSAPLVSATTTISEVKLESVAHAAWRIKNKNKDAIIKAWAIVGQKPHKIEVRPSGHIDGINEENNVWDEIVRTLIPKIFDISAIKWDHHKPKSLDKLRQVLMPTFNMWAMKFLWWASEIW
jgi:hypothetical protein